MPHLPRTWVAALLAVISLPAVAAAQLPGGTTWALVFADEFAGGTLDTMKWSPNYSWGRTHNHQAYMDPGQLTVSNGRLRIQAVQERHPDAPSHAVHDGKWYRLDYTSGAVNTADTFRFTNGYVEARMRLPGEIGAWAA
jgi:beta-glucanase (GH16 family)